MQSSAALPAAGSVADAPAHFSRERLLTTRVWQLYLDRLSATTCDRPKLALSIVQGLVSELAGVLTRPAWPAAELMLHVLAVRVHSAETALGTLKGAARAEVGKDDREHLVELEGSLAATVRSYGPVGCGSGASLLTSSRCSGASLLTSSRCSTRVCAVGDVLACVHFECAHRHICQMCPCFGEELAHAGYVPCS